MNEELRSYLDDNFFSLAKKVDFQLNVHDKIESLATITRRGFEGIHKRLDRIDERLDSIDNLLIHGLK